MTLTIGNIPLKKIEKEELSIHGMHPLHFNGESLGSGSNSSFDIILPQLIKYFNNDQAILIKNFPNQMLSEEQQEIKNKLIHFDKEKEFLKQMERFRDNMTEAAERGEKMVCKLVPHEYSEQMRQAMLHSGICFVPFTTKEGYLNIVVLEKDKDAFLQVQASVFGKKSSTKQNLQEEQIKDNDKKTKSK